MDRKDVNNSKKGRLIEGMSKRYEIDREEVSEAWKAVRRAAGGAGIDGKTIEQIEKKLDEELYKIWNRLSS